MYLGSNVEVESNLNNGFVDALNSLTEGALSIANAFFLVLQRSHFVHSITLSLIVSKLKSIINLHSSEYHCSTFLEPASTCISGALGLSYAESIPVKFFISPARAFL